MVGGKGAKDCLLIPIRKLQKFSLISSQLYMTKKICVIIPITYDEILSAIHHFNIRNKSPRVDGLAS